jgi:hypothetical protein
MDVIRRATVATVVYFDLEQIALTAVLALSWGELKMLTVLAILSGPILVATISMIAVAEIKSAWRRNGLR